MANETEVAGGSATPAVEVKKSRRGLGTARGTVRLKFSHEQAKANGLFIGHLDSVTVSEIAIGEDKTGMPSFNGMSIPKITFLFASNEPEVNKRHYITLQFTAVESNVNTIPGGSEEWKVNCPLDWLKHILNVYVLKGRELTDKEEEALSLSYEDFDEQGEYVPIEPETVINSWKVLFENFENIINRGNDGKPYYKDAKGKDIPIWMKLLRYIKNRKSGWQAINNGELSFPAFVGEGCIEIMTANSVPSIRVNVVREAIIPMNIDKPKKPNMDAPAIGNAVIGNAGIPINMGMQDNTDYNAIAMAASDDVPF